MASPIYTRSVIEFFKRAECTTDACEEMPTSTWEKTGIPVIISVVLFLAVFIVMFIIVRKRRIQNKLNEEAAGGKIDLDDVEDRAAFSRQHIGKK